MAAASPKNANCLLIKTSSEIALKSTRVRHYFTKKLLSAIKISLKRNNIPYERIARGGGRLYIFTPKLRKAAAALQMVIGIHAIAFAAMGTFREYSEIEKAVVSWGKNFLKKGDSFALRARHTAEIGLSSKDLENKLGKAVMDAIPGLKVNLSSPKKEIFIEVRKKDFFVYNGEIPGMRGLPVGVEGNVVFLFEGKEKEPLAALLMLLRGCNIFPVVEKKSKKIEALIRKLIPFNNYRKFAITELGGLQQLIREREIQAIATAESGTAEKDFAIYKKFNLRQKMAVLRPLLLYPKGLIKEKSNLF